jgi:Tol biopolymer transport system component
MKKIILLVVLALVISLLLGCSTTTVQTAGPATTLTPALMQLAFAGNRSGHYSLYLINDDGSGETSIVGGPCDDLHPSWSPNGNTIVLQCEENNQTQLDSMNSDGQQGQVLAASGFQNPDFSPYGNLIICVGSERVYRGVHYEMGYAGDPSSYLATVNLAGAVGRINIIQPGKLGNNDMYLDFGTSIANPSVSPDGNMIAFETNVRVVVPVPVTTTTTTTTNQSGSVSDQEPTNVNPPSDYTPPQPGVAEPGKRICVVDFDGTNLKQLTTGEGNYDDTYPTWSPDGKKIVFVSNRTGNNEIYVMNADGTGQTQITNDTFDNHDPAWSPDGSYIAYVADHSGISELCLIRPDGTQRRRINSVAEQIQNPAWRPISGGLNGLQAPTIPYSSPVSSSAPTTVHTTVVQPNPPQVASTTGELVITVANNSNPPYSIYINGGLVGGNYADKILSAGSYRVTVYNGNGKVIYDEDFTVIAGKVNQIRINTLD